MMGPDAAEEEDPVPDEVGNLIANMNDKLILLG